MSKPVPLNLFWSSDSVAPAQRLAAWREVYAQSFVECDIDTLGSEPFNASLRHEWFGDISLGILAGSPMRYRITAEQAKQNEEGFLLDMVWRGSYHYKQSGHEAVLRPGDAVFCHNNNPGAVQTLHDVDTRQVFIPVQVAQCALGDPDRLIGRVIRAEHGECRLLAAYIDMLQKTSVPGDLRARTLIGRHLAELVELAIGARNADPESHVTRGRRAAQLRLARDIIARRCSEPMLNGVRIAKDLGVSQRYLQKLFEEEGETVSDLIQAERLNRARLVLSDPAHDRRPIAEVAYACGFSDVSHFSRCFRRRFNETPSAFRTGR